MPLKQGELNYQQSPLYDTYELAKTTALPVKIVFFETPTGAVKGINLTNMHRPFQLVSPENFKVYALRFVPSAMNEADLVAFHKNYVVNLIVSGKLLLDAPMDFWSGGAGLVLQTEGASAGVVEYANNGCADPRAVVILNKEPILIGSGESFSVELNGTTFDSTEAIFLRCYLEGIYGRAIG